MRLISPDISRVQAAPHNAELSHELIAGAASYEALKAAGVGGAFIDRLVETKGLDYLDAQKAKKKAEEHYQEHYQNN
ncbi:hypothetical protein OG21DRAFT_1486522 [Imleria badia]|nr:hypothetical protein OG21DRAFT_1486522 [Imleria badia]